MVNARSGDVLPLALMLRAVFVILHDFIVVVYWVLAAWIGITI